MKRKGMILGAMLFILSGLMTGCKLIRLLEDQQLGQVQTSDSSVSETDFSTQASQDKPLWSEEKAQKLRDYMARWGETQVDSLGDIRTFDEYSLDNPLNLYGISMPDFFLPDDETPMTPDFAGETPTVILSDTGEVAEGETALVALYASVPKMHMGIEALFFTILDGQPKIWLCRQNQGNPERKLYFKEFKDKELLAFFEALVTDQLDSTTMKVAPDIDTKNLTQEQAEIWVLSDATGRSSSQNLRNLVKENLQVVYTPKTKSEDGLVYLSVYEKNLDASKDPVLAGVYRINTDGHLEKKVEYNNSYKRVAVKYATNPLVDI